MKNWKVMILVVFALIWLVDAKPWKSDSESSGPVRVSDTGAVTASTYEQVMANDSRSAGNGGSGGNSGGSSDTGITGSTYEEVEYCRACMSTGTCKICGGDGVYRNSFNMSQELPCTACTHGSIEDVGKCQICGGDGILYN